MLKVLRDEHRNNFRRLLSSVEVLVNQTDAGSGHNANTANLLRFYAAEVGLKYLLNKVINIPFKHERASSPAYVERYSHDLPKMVEALKLPAGRVPAPPPQPHRCVPGFDDGSGGQQLVLSEAHEAWRYGLTVAAADEREIVDYLIGITDYLKKEISP